MQEKIKWYQEVLELEPGSKVFFPLARLLAESDQIDAALATLQHGLVRHPEFIEARLYLIDLLFKNNRAEQCDGQVAQLTGLFASYSGFWEAWGAYFANTGQGKDVALALTFLAATFQRPDLTLSDIFSQGLRAVHAPDAPACTHPQSTPDLTASPVPVPANLSLDDFESLHEDIEDDSADNVESTETMYAAELAPEEPVVARMEIMESQPPSPPTVPPLAELVLSLPPTDDGEENEERFSLRTRSMAEVLAEQGDIKSALDIYQELWQSAALPEEKLDLQHRISTLTARLGSVQNQDTDTPPPATAQGKHRLLSLLETLAVRFEAHAQG